MRSSKGPASAALQCFIAVLVATLARPQFALAAPPELLTRVALAASGPRIAVIVVSLDAKSAAQQGALEGAALEALERASRFTVISAHDAFNPGAAKKREARLDDAAEKMKAGKQALDDLDTVKATEAFGLALDGLQSADLSRDFPTLLEAWSMKAASHATGGETAPAKKDIEGIVGVSPRAEFSPTFFPPDLLKFVETQRKLAGNAKGELLVRTEPPGARVWVDGSFRGISPVTVAGLSSARHFVTASLGGYALAQSLATPGEEVVSLAAAELGPGFKKATSDIKKDPEGSTRDSAAQSLAKAAQLDQVLLVLAKKSVAGEKLDLIALRLEARDGHNAAYGVGTLSGSDPEALAGFFDGLTGKDAKRDGKDAVHHFKGGGGSPVKMAAGLGLIGLGVVGIATGIGLGVAAGGRVAEFHSTPQTNSFVSQNLVKEGRGLAIGADVSYIIGILAAGGGTVLLLTNGPSGSDDGAGGDGKSSEDKRRETDRRAAEERRASEERRKEDERRREDDKKREDDRRRDNEAKATEDKRRADEAAAAKKPDDEAPKKLSKKEQAALDKKKREDEARQKKEEEQARQEEERRAAEEKKRAEDEERAKKADEQKNAGKLSKKQREEEERKKRDDEEARKAADAEAQKKADEQAARKKAEDEAAAKKKAEEEKKKTEKKDEKKDEKKKDEDHDDLRNY